MIAPSTRYVPLLVGVVALLLFPILRSGFEVRRVDDCARPTELLEIGRLAGSGAMMERYERYDIEVRQWTETDLRPQLKGAKLRGALIRSFRPVDLYTRPPTRILGPIEAGQRNVEWVELGADRLPIQTIFDSANGRNTMASYLFVYGGEPVEHPVWSQIWSAPAQVWGGTQPLSLLLVAGPVRPQQREAAREQARRWLLAAYRHHRSVCTPEAEASAGS